MKLLLDTHAVLWFHQESPNLSAIAAQAIEDPDNECYVSYGSLWEMAIKSSLRKLRLPVALPRFVQKHVVGAGFTLLTIGLDHLTAVSSLPHHHGDPFDRLLVAQSLSEGWPLVSNESTLERYGISRVW